MRIGHIVIATGPQRMTIVDKTMGNLVRLTHYSWWYDSKQWCGRCTWLGRDKDKWGKPIMHEMMATYDSPQALAASLSFEAGCEVKP